MFVAYAGNVERSVSQRAAAQEAERRRVRQAAFEALQTEARRNAEIREQARIIAIEMMAARSRAGQSYLPSYSRIERRICKALHVSHKELRSNRRHADLVFARQAVMYWSRRLSVLSLPQIGRLMGGRDHTTVLHGSLAYPEKRAKMGRALRPAR